MEVANTLAYYDIATVTAVKGFIGQAPVVETRGLVSNPFRGLLNGRVWTTKLFTNVI